MKKWERLNKQGYVLVEQVFENYKNEDNHACIINLKLLSYVRKF